MKTRSNEFREHVKFAWQRMLDGRREKYNGELSPKALQNSRVTAADENAITLINIEVTDESALAGVDEKTCDGIVSDLRNLYLYHLIGQGPTLTPIIFVFQLPPPLDTIRKIFYVDSSNKKGAIVVTRVPKGAGDHDDGQRPEDILELEDQLAKNVHKYGRQFVKNALARVSQDRYLGDGESARAISLQDAARLWSVPDHFLWKWARQGKIPVLQQPKGPGSTTYLDKEAAEQVAEIYHEAKRQGRRPIKLFEELMSDQ